MKSEQIIFLGIVGVRRGHGARYSGLGAYGVQVGTSGKSYSSTEVQCALNPITGMAPMVQAGLCNPKKNANGTVSLNGNSVATVTFLSPDTNLWLANGPNTVVVALDKRTADTYSFDATSLRSDKLLHSRHQWQ